MKSGVVARWSGRLRWAHDFEWLRNESSFALGSGSGMSCRDPARRCRVRTRASRAPTTCSLRLLRRPRQANPATGLSKLEIGEHQPWPQEALDAFPVALAPDLARGCTGKLSLNEGCFPDLSMAHPRARCALIKAQSRQNQHSRQAMSRNCVHGRPLTLSAKGRSCTRFKIAEIFDLKGGSSGGCRVD